MGGDCEILFPLLAPSQEITRFYVHFLKSIHSVLSMWLLPSLPSLSSVFLALTENISPRELYMPGPKGGQILGLQGRESVSKGQYVHLLFGTQHFRRQGWKAACWTPWGWPTLPSEMVMRSLWLSWQTGHELFFKLTHSIITYKWCVTVPYYYGVTVDFSFHGC